MHARTLAPHVIVGLVLGLASNAWSVVSAQEPASCGVYAAALEHLRQGEARMIVVYDSVSLATPTFAFHAWHTRGRPEAGSPVPLTDSLWEAMRSAHRVREALPACFGAGWTVVRVPYDSLRAPFRDREAGWANFGQVFPGAGGFLVVGRPLFINAAGDEALVYVGRAVYWLAGSGTMLYLRRMGGAWRVIATHAMWGS
jgi:hypothetical protein